MKNLYIFNPTKTDPLSRFRGGGRILQILKENFPQAKFVTDLNILLNGRAKNVKNLIFINPYFSPFQNPKILKRLAKKQIQIIFDVIPLKYPSRFPIGLKGKFNLWLNKLALKNYDKIITTSNHSKRDIVRYLRIPEKKIEVFYPTLSQTFLNPKSQVANSKQYSNSNNQNSKYFEHLNLFGNWQLAIGNYCLYVGDVNWNKNLVNLARAIKIINLTCVFVGKSFERSNVLTFKRLGHPWLKEFRDFLTEVADDKRFIFLGYVPDSQLIKFYQQAKVNILISRDEGFGFSFLEAASQRCPSVLSDIKVFHEIAGSSAVFTNPEDPNDIANKIGEIYFNKGLRDKLGERAKERINKFSAIKFKKDFLKALS